MIIKTKPVVEPECRYSRVYVVQCHETGRIKIGRSRTPWRRAHSIATGAPTSCSVAFVVDPGPRIDGHELERELHQLFHAKRVRGEWFQIPAELVEYALTGGVALRECAA